MMSITPKYSTRAWLGTSVKCVSGINGTGLPYPTKQSLCSQNIWKRASMQFSNRLCNTLPLWKKRNNSPPVVSFFSAGTFFLIQQLTAKICSSGRSFATRALEGEL